jgi:hypothetical protein
LLLVFWIYFACSPRGEAAGLPAEILFFGICASIPFWKSPDFNLGTNGDFVIAGGSPGL